MLKHLYLCYFLLAFAWLPLNAQKTAITGKTYAVVIGIAHYRSKALPVLQYPDRDASMFSDWLQSKAGGSVPLSQIKLLINEDATIAAVYDALDWLKEQCGQHDIGYIYFSGHGDVETKNSFSLGYLLAYNSPASNYRNNAIRIEDLNNKANILSIKNKAKVILITDACHSGKLAGDFYKGKQLVADQLRLVLNNEVRLAACGTNEEAAEGPDWGGGRGIFSYYLLNGLDGLADLQKDGTIELQELTKFLDSSFTTDKYLLQDNHHQHPVTDGNPYFPLAITDPATTRELTKAHATGDSAASMNSGGLQSLQAIGVQPIDYFFTVFQQRAIENILHFNSYSGIPADSLPLRMLNDCITYQVKINKINDSLNKAGTEQREKDFASLDSLKSLQQQLKKSRQVASRFNEKFIEKVHEKGQEMINAYLEGDLAELEKRQYYYAGNRQYMDFLAMLTIALSIVPPSHSLADVLKVNNSYLTGLIERMEMATQRNTDRLLNSAFSHQREALRLEPYAAYIHNELGNLYLHRKRYDSAGYHFNLANTLAPTWSVPWSNKIRMNLALKQPGKAKEAIHIADSLQPGLSYVMLNAGLVMEQEGNWLAAASFYKKSIAHNNVHYLPYERLGYIYMRTGEYAKADTFLFEASTRKDYFAVNDEYFEFGIELGGPPPSMTQQKFPDSCNLAVTPVSPEREPYINLANGLRELGLPPSNQNHGLQLTRQAIQQLPGIALAHHYLGKELYRLGMFRQAEEALLQAIANYRNETSLRKELKQLWYNKATGDSCLLQVLLFYHYDVLEDYYLLGQLYEKQALFEKAIEQYTVITGIENKRQAQQATYEGYPLKISLDSDEGYSLVEKLLQQYEIPLRLGGTIKAARLYEKMGEFGKAEKALLNQVTLNRAAGDSRQAAFDSGKPGAYQLPGGMKVNFYWLGINREIESETYNFYRRMMTLYPRDFEWKQKAGLFLHDRLSLAFNQAPVGEYQSFYESISRYAYPWMGGESIPNDTDIKWLIPGTGETITIEMPVYDPVKQSLEWLQQSVKLSGESEPRSEVAEAIGDVQSWLGNHEDAINQYAALMRREPANDLLRNKFINYLVANSEWPAACEQLDVLYKRKKILAPQLPILATYRILSGRYGEGLAVLNHYKPPGDTEKNEVAWLTARSYWLSDKPEKALAYLLDSLPVIRITESDDEDTKSGKNIKNCDRLYSIARLYKTLKKEDEAMMILKKALDEGFYYKYVLDHDPLWTGTRDNKKWKALMAKYEFGQVYPDAPVKEYRSPIQYSIPGQSILKLTQRGSEYLITF